MQVGTKTSNELLLLHDGFWSRRATSGGHHSHVRSSPSYRAITTSLTILTAVTLGEIFSLEKSTKPGRGHCLHQTSDEDASQDTSLEHACSQTP